MIDRYCKAKGINYPGASTSRSIMEKVMTRYAFKDWDSVLASIGHGGLKEGQVINKMLEERDKKQKKEVTDADIRRHQTDMTSKAAGGRKSPKAALW